MSSFHDIVLVDAYRVGPHPQGLRDGRPEHLEESHEIGANFKRPDKHALDNDEGQQKLGL